MQKAAIKKMDMLASKEFLAELNVLTRVHHLNLVLLFLSLKTVCVLWNRLIFICPEQEFSVVVIIHVNQCRLNSPSCSL